MIMKRSLKTLCGFFAVLALLVSCNATTPLAYDGPVPNKELHNYFYANNAGKTPPTKITTEDTFERYFGESAYMGKSGEPTSVDFDAQFVGNGAGNFDIVAGQFAVFVVVSEWCVSSFRTDSDGTFVVDALNQRAGGRAGLCRCRRS